MSKTPVLTAIDAIRGLKKAGFVLYRQARGSHEIWYNPATKTFPIIQARDIPKGTLKAILKEAGISFEDFLSLLD
ncbi:MAG: type II toxin-antitoxin system HicA family toxin [Methanothrix sp.]